MALNVTVTNPSSAGFLTVFPGGGIPPSSSLDFVAGQTVPNMVIIGLDQNGVSIYNALGTTDVIVDVQGWFTGTSFHGVTPARVLDTRNASPFVAGQTTALPIAGLNGIPADAKAVAINLTATNPTEAGYLTVWPANTPMPTASNVNFSPGQTVPNMAIVGVNAGAFNIFNALGTTDVIVDVTGYFSDDNYRPITPSRQVDTRNGQCGVTLHSGDQLDMGLGQAGGGSAVALNVTATNGTATGFLTLYPAGAPRPVASNVNYVSGQTVANAALTQTGVDGRVSLFNFGGDVDVVVDVQGWFGAPISTSGVCSVLPATPPPPPPPPANPNEFHSGGLKAVVTAYDQNTTCCSEANVTLTNESTTATSWNVNVHWADGTTGVEFELCINPGQSSATLWFNFNSHTTIVGIEASFANPRTGGQC